MYLMLERILKSLKPCFCNEYVELCNHLYYRGFHPSICSHPSILFDDKSIINKEKRFISIKLTILAKFIQLGLLKSEKGHQILKTLGIPLYYGRGLEFWFVEPHSEMIPYSVPNLRKEHRNVVVYTVLTGDYDVVNEILYKEEGVDYLLFTNNRKIKSRTWRVVYVESNLDDVLLSREIKMLPHKYIGTKYDESVYIDANAVIYGEIAQLTNYLNDNCTLILTKHSQRNTVKEEFDACVSLKGINAEVAQKQYLGYLYRGFHDDNSIPLVECGIIIRNHNDSTLQEVMRVWFEEYKCGIKRDQLSIIPVISLLNFKNFLIIDGSVWHNQFNKLVNHKYK